MCGDANEARCARCRAFQDEAGAQVGFGQALADGLRLLIISLPRLAAVLPFALAISVACRYFAAGFGLTDEGSAKGISLLARAGQLVIRTLENGGVDGIAAGLRAALIIPVFVDEASSTRTNLGSRLSRVLPRVPALLIADSFLGAAISAGMVMLCIPGVLLASLFAFTELFIITEKMGPASAAGASIRLAFRRFGLVLGLLSLYCLVAGGTGLVAGTVLKHPLMGVPEHVRALLRGLWSVGFGIASDAIFTALFMRQRRAEQSATAASTV